MKNINYFLLLVMTKFTKILLTAIIAVCYSNFGFSQSLKERIDKAEVIYVAPLQFHNYFALELAGGGSGSYSYTNEYNVGDMVSDGTDPNVAYEIANIFPQDKMDAINEQLLARCKKEFGEDKVKLWPKELKTKMTGGWDQKKIEGDFYIILQRAAWTSPVSIKTFESSNPAVASRVVGGGDAITLTIFEKVKAGKKGKKMARIIKNSYSGMDPKYVEYTGDGYSEAAKKLSETAIENFSKVVNDAIDELIAKISTAS